jgi:hypothetical protein
MSRIVILHSYISKKNFRPGGMAPSRKNGSVQAEWHIPSDMAQSEWTRSERAVRDNPVVDDTAPSINSTKWVPYHPLIAVSPFLLGLLVSYCKPSLWCCGQLWPYIGMDSLDMCLHRDCNGMGDATKITPHVPSTRAQNEILLLLILQDCKSMGDTA